MGRRRFASSEIQAIRDLLAQKVQADPSKQKWIRQQIRDRDFNISDFGRPPEGFGPDDLDELIESGQISVNGGEDPPAVWWVNQGQSFRAELQGGFLWAPQTTKAGYPVQHHTDMRKLRVDDVVISYSNTAIRALIRITGGPTDASRPEGIPEEPWLVEGIRAEGTYWLLDNPIRLREISADTRVPENGPFSSDGSVKQGYLFSTSSDLAEDLRTQFADRWPPGSPWADYDLLTRNATHLLFKWSADQEPRTVDLHREVADARGSVWWGKFGTRERAALSEDNINRIRRQIDNEIPTYVYIYRAGETWETRLEEITDDPDQIDVERLPSYYGTDACELFVRISNFDQLEDNWPAENLVLASNPDPEKMPGALGNQRTPLMVKQRGTQSPRTVSTSVSNDVMTFDELIDETSWDRDDIIELLDALDTTRQVVLAGPPGTGKTWVAKAVARFLTKGDSLALKTVQFHPSYGYEEFIEGLRPDIADGGKLTFEVRPGVIPTMVEAMEGTTEPHVLIIDEMNRANLPRVLGELMYLFEYRDEPIDLQYTADFQLPENLRFIGTMNTADRSIRAIDIALRRRFDVFDCPPSPTALERYYEKPEHSNEVSSLVDGFEALNARLTEDLDRHHTIGHTFFMNPTMNHKELTRAWNRKIGPLIEEYFFDQSDLAGEYTVESFWSEE